MARGQHSQKCQLLRSECIQCPAGTVGISGEEREYIPTAHCHVKTSPLPNANPIPTGNAGSITIQKRLSIPTFPTSVCSVAVSILPIIPIPIVSIDCASECPRFAIPEGQGAEAEIQNDDHYLHHHHHHHEEQTQKGR